MPHRMPRRRAPLVVALALLAALAAPRPAPAQPPDVDTRVRITVGSPTRSIVGLLGRVSADSVAVRDGGGRPLAAVARGDVRRFEVSGGRERRGAAFRRGALRGALFGAGAGAFAGWFGDTCRDRDGDPRTCESEVSRGGQIAGGAAIGGLIGALIGGFAARPRERWATAELPARVGLVPFGARRVAAMATVRF